MWLEANHKSWRSVSALRQKWCVRQVFYRAIIQRHPDTSEDDAVKALQLRLDACAPIGKANKPGWKQLHAVLLREAQQAKADAKAKEDLAYATNTQTDATDVPMAEGMGT